MHLIKRSSRDSLKPLTTDTEHGRAILLFRSDALAWAWLRIHETAEVRKKYNPAKLLRFQLPELFIYAESKGLKFYVARSMADQYIDGDLWDAIQVMNAWLDPELSDLYRVN